MIAKERRFYTLESSHLLMPRIFLASASSYPAPLGSSAAGGGVVSPPPLSSRCGDKTQRLVRPDQRDSATAVREAAPASPSAAAQQHALAHSRTFERSSEVTLALRLNPSRIPTIRSISSNGSSYPRRNTPHPRDTFASSSSGPLDFLLAFDWISSRISSAPARSLLSLSFGFTSDTWE